MKRTELKQMIREEVLNELSFGGQISNMINVIEYNAKHLREEIRDEADSGLDALERQSLAIIHAIDDFKKLLKQTKL